MESVGEPLMPNLSYLRFYLFFILLKFPKSLIINYTNLERHQRRNRRNTA